MIEPFKSLGFKDMHHDQVEALLKLIGHALKLADDIGEQEIFDEVFADAEELVLLFGGNCIQINTEVTVET